MNCRAIFFVFLPFMFAFGDSEFEPSYVIGAQKHPAFKGFVKNEELKTPRSVKFHPSKKQLYVQLQESGKSMAIKLDNPRKPSFVEHIFLEDTQYIHEVLDKHGIFKQPGRKIGWIARPIDSVMDKSGTYLFVSSDKKSYDDNGVFASSISVVGIKSQKTLFSIPSSPSPKKIALSDDSKTLAVVNRGDNSVSFWNVDWQNGGPKLINHIWLGTPSSSSLALSSAAFDKNGDYLLVAGAASNGEMYVVSPAEGLKKPIVLPSKQITDIVFSKKSGSFFVSTTAKEICQVSERSIEEIVGGAKPSEKGSRCKNFGGSVKGLDISDKTGIGAALLSEGCEMAVFDLKSMQILQKLPTPCTPLYVAVSPDGETIAVTTQGGVRGDEKVAVYKKVQKQKEPIAVETKPSQNSGGDGEQNIQKQNEEPQKEQKGVSATEFEKILIIVDSAKNKMTVKGESGGEEVKIREYKVSTAKSTVKKPTGEGGVTSISLAPSWFPDDDTIKRFKKTKGIDLPKQLPPGHPQNYMGAAKISLTHTVDGKSVYRIHGTLNEKTIGTKESAGCIRMKNKEVAELASMLKEFAGERGMDEIKVVLK